VSTLTKVFLVLYVVLSLLLVAGVVTFVNTSSSTQQAVESARKERDTLKEDNGRLGAQVASMQAQTTLALSQKDSVITDLRNQLNAAQQQIAQRDSANAELTANLGLATTAQSTANDALKAMQAAYAERSKNYDDLRAAFDKQQRQLVDSGLRIDDLTNVVDVTRRQNKYFGEQVAQLQQDLGKANAVLKQNGLTLNTTDNSALAGPAVPVNAKVEETQVIGGVHYATINAGSTDAIARNMKLSVVDPRSHQFLGYIVVDQVYPHQAIGRLEGPHVNDVQPQVAEVRSQL